MNPKGRSCKWGRYRYRTYKRAAKDCTERQAAGEDVRVYACGACNGWHITRREIERPA